MTAIGYMPLLKAGSTLFTAVVIYHRMCQSSSASFSLGAIYGKESEGCSPHVLESTTEKSTKWLFGPGTSTRQVLEQHTLFGAYSRAMAPHVAATLANQLSTGIGSRFRWAFRGHRGRRIPPLATAHARSCEKCIEEDTDQQGFTSWRVLHSLPSIGHCPQHGIPLRDEGKARRDSAGWALRLPGEQRSRITDGKAMDLPISNGYAAYLQLWTEAFEGNLTGLVPHLWMLVMDAVIQRFGTVDRACEKISSVIEESWEASLAHIARSLEIADGGDFVRAELEQRVQASYVASRLVICGALDALHLSPPRRHSSPRLLPIELSPMKSFGAWLTPQTQAELSTRVIDGNFPPALFRAMAEDLDIFKLDARLHIDRYVIRKFAESLPDDLLYRMSMEQSWDRSSWLMKEIRRREDSWSRDRRLRGREERERPATSTPLGRGSAAASKQ